MFLQPLEFLEILPGQPDYIFKVLVVGNSYVGKSSFLMQLCNHSFSQRYSSTIGKCVCVCADFASCIDYPIPHHRCGLLYQSIEDG